jgi:hypothetical protein
MIGKPGKCPSKMVCAGRNLGLDRNFLLVEIEVDDAVDQLK